MVRARRWTVGWLLAVMAASGAWAAEPELLDATCPAYHQGQVLVGPVKVVATWLRAAVDWKPGEDTLYVTRRLNPGRARLKLTVGARVLEVNGQSTALPAAIATAHGVLYAPLLPVLKALGVKQQWSDQPRGLLLTNGDQQALWPVVPRRYALVTQDGLVVGGRLDDRWVPAAELTPALAPGARCWHYSLTQSPDASVEWREPWSALVKPTFADPARAAEPWVLFNGPWSALVRRPRPEDPANSPYALAVKQIVGGFGVKVDKPVLRQSVRLDLDGQGEHNVVLAASSLDPAKLPAQAQPGDYSVVLLLHEREHDKPQVTVISCRTWRAGGQLENPVVDQFVAALDLTGAGQPQLLCSQRSVAKRGLTVYALAEGQPRLVLSAEAPVPVPAAP